MAFSILFLFLFISSINAVEVKKVKNRYGGQTIITNYSEQDNEQYEFKKVKRKELYQNKGKKTIKMVYFFYDDYVDKLELSKTKQNKTLEVTYYNQAGIKKYQVDKKVVLKYKGKVERQEYFRNGKKVEGDC